MRRELKAKARRLRPNHILGLREGFATSRAKGAELSWSHGFGFGITMLAIEVKFPDGTYYAETLALAPLMKEWASQILKEHEQVDPCVAAGEHQFRADHRTQECPVYHEGES